jgi:protein TonB
VQTAVDQVAIGGLAPPAAIAMADTFTRAALRPSPVILEQGRGTQVYRAGGLVSPPEPIHREEPEYTAAARTAGVEGTVLLSVTIGENGTVSDAKVVRGIDPALDSKAMECVRKWTFRPAMKDGKPVSAAANIEMNFRL